MPGFLTRARQETGADKPKFGGGGSWVDVEAMVARESVFAIVAIEWDGDNEYNGKPRPRWVLDIIPWYQGETLPGKAGDDGRLTQLDAGKLGLASHASRDPLLNTIADEFEDESSSEVVDGVFNSPGVLVKIRVPGGKGGRYIDLCEWDEENERPILSKGAEIAPAEDDEPRRPTGRSAPARGGQPRPQRQAEPEPEGDNEPEPTNGPPARRGAGSARREGASRQSTGSRTAREGAASPQASTSSGFVEAGGAESDGPTPVPAPAFDIALSDLDMVASVLGVEPYQSFTELAEEYVLEEGRAFPVLKVWLVDHGITDFPAGRGRIKSEYRNAYSIALRCWMEHTGRDAKGQPTEQELAQREHDEKLYGPEVTDIASRTSPNPAVRSGEVTPSGAQHNRRVQAAQVPTNAHEADQRMRPPEAVVRPEDKAAWLPPDQRERGPQPATEHVYEPNDVGDSVEACPDCQKIATARAFPSGAGSYAIMHQCPTSGAMRPLQAHNIRKE